MLIDHPKLNKNKLKAIGLNTQACNNMNWHMWHTLRDPQDHIAWLEQELMIAETNEEKVLIIGHIPPNDEDCLDDFSKRFKALSERYQHVIRGFYFGHTHKEELAVNRGVNDLNPLQVFWTTASVTTETGKNPSFRIFELDAETFLPVKIDKYFFNITRANELNEPLWHHMYEFTEEYELENLSPSSILKLADKIKLDEQLAVKYLKNKHSMGPDSDQIKSCDEECRTELYCDMVNGHYYGYRDCLGAPHIDFIHDTGAIFEVLADPWIDGPKPY